jgi:hypothetical protein
MASSPIDRLVQYMVEQHFIARAIAVDDLFVPLADAGGS